MKFDCLFVQIINFYFKLIARECNKENIGHVLAFNSFFYSKLARGGYNEVKKWTKKVSYDPIIRYTTKANFF